MGIHQLGTAKKLFKELKEFDKLYYLHPRDPNTIAEITVKEVIPAEKKGWVKIIYYKSDEAYNLIPNKADAPVGSIICEGSGTQLLTLSNPPNIYATNKKWLSDYMHTLKRSHE